MDWQALEVFRAVATERSFSRAAEKLFRTQPAVSLAVQRLEAGARRAAHRPGRQDAAADRRRAAGARLRPPRRQPARGDGERPRGTARSLRRPLDDRCQRVHQPVPAAAHRRLPPAVPARAGAGAAQSLEPDPGPTGGRRPRAGRDQLRPAGPAPHVHGHLHRPPGVRGLASPSPGLEAVGVHPGPGDGELHRPQRRVALPEPRAAGVRAPQGAAAHGRGDAHRGDDPDARAGERGRGVPAADVRRAGDRAARALRSPGEGAEAGAPDPARLPVAPRS